MTRFIAAAALFALAAPAAAQTATVQQAADDLAGAVNRITALEARVSALEQGHAAPQTSGKRSYASAYQLAIAENKPLIVWNRDAICASCIGETEGEWINYVGDAPGCPMNAITVSVPEGGELWKAEPVTTWVTGDSRLGHIPSVRAALARFRANRGARIAQAASAPMMAYQPVGFAAAPQAMFYGGGMMMGGAGGGGACASCGGGSAGRGFFRR